MKKQFFKLLSLLGPFGTAVAILAALACTTFAMQGIVSSISRVFTPVVVETSGGNAVVKKFEAKFQYKPLMFFDSGIIVKPKFDEGEDLPSGIHLPAKNFARMVAQYSGYAEYVVDIDISPEDVTTNEMGKIVSVRLSRPRCPFESVGSTDSMDANRLFIIDGTDSEWKMFYEKHYGQIVTAAIHEKAMTEENRKAAEEQTQRMLSAMIGDLAADPVKGVEIDWIDN